LTVIVLRAVVVSNVDVDLLQRQLIELNNHTLRNIPLAEVGEVLDVELGLVLKKIIKLVMYTVWSSVFPPSMVVRVWELALM